MPHLPPDATTLRLAALCSAYLRPGVAYYLDDATGPTVEFNPALTTVEQTTYSDLTVMAKFGITADLSPVEFAAIRPDLATARQYVGLASPTGAQTAAGLKALIRVVGALLRQ